MAVIPHFYLHQTQKRREEERINMSEGRRSSSEKPPSVCFLTFMAFIHETSLAKCLALAGENLTGDQPFPDMVGEGGWTKVWFFDTIGWLCPLYFCAGESHKPPTKELRLLFVTSTSKRIRNGRRWRQSR